MKTGRVALLLAVASALPSAAQESSRQTVERLARIAVTTEWVTTNCGAAGLDGMLLLTMRSVIRQLDAGDLARLRANFARRAAAEFSTRARACEVWRGRLVEIQ